MFRDSVFLAQVLSASVPMTVGNTAADIGPAFRPKMQVTCNPKNCCCDNDEHGQNCADLIVFFDIDIVEYS